MTEPQISAEAIAAAARCWQEWASFAPLPEAIRAVLAAAYPHLRRQIETEVREQIAGQLLVRARWHDSEQIGFSAVGDAYANAARLARGAAQPGGTE